MQRPRLAAFVVVLAASAAPFVACGSIPSSTECSFDPKCASTTTSTQTQTDSGAVDAPATDTGACKPGDIKKVDCNTCTCSPTGQWLCTGLACPDSGPAPSKCPDKATPGESCHGNTHCIYTTPCAFGCDCVDGTWKCVDCTP
jgi:hypothetical protein